MDPSCPICGHDLKDIPHIIRDCTTAKEVLKQVVPSNQQLYFSLTIFTNGFLLSCRTFRSFIEELVGLASSVYLLGTYGRIVIFSSFKGKLGVQAR